MHDITKSVLQLQATTVTKRCSDPSNDFIPFNKAEIEGSISERFERVVCGYPDRLAVKTDSQTLTYAELDKASNRVAHAILARRGKGAEPVVLLLEHGVAPIVALMGVLKAGKFYVVLDPSYPQNRLTDILKDIQTGLIVTNQKNVSLTAKLAPKECQLINLDELNSRFSDEQICVSISPDSLAAIFYTSGSTGQPKGVMREHRRVLHNAYCNTKTYHVCVEDRHSLLFFCNFGVSEVNIFTTLLNGAALCPYNIREAGLSRLIHWLIREKITIFHSVVPLFRQFLDTLTGNEKFPHLRLIRLGGQPLYKRDIERFRRHFLPDCILVCELGLTEAGLVTQLFIDQKTEIDNVMPVGYAIEGKEILMLDNTGQKVDFNCIGEIAVRSHYLAPGYWNDSELTHQKFLSDPEGGDKRIYLTGDLGRMRSDGCLEYLGRKDFQVKIRGYRIELAEIEAALYNLDVVKDAVVIAHEQDAGDKRLVAYVVPATQLAPTVSGLRHALTETLPEYMIPSIFVILNTLPLTPTGKVDWQALPAPDLTRPVVDTEFVAPRNALEGQLTSIWEQVLEIHPIGIRDNFFDLGGNSLLAGRVLAELNKILGVHLPMVRLFQAPTIEQLAETIQHNQISTSFFSLIPIQDQGTLPPLFFLYPPGRALRYSVRGTYGLVAHLGDNQPIYGLRYGLAHTQDLDQLPLPPRQIEDLAAHYIQEIQQIQPEGPYFLCGRSGGGLVAFEMACQLHQQGQEIGMLVLLDAFHPLRYRYCPNAVTRRLKYYTSTLFTSPYRGLLAQFRSLLYLYLTGVPRRYPRRWLEVLPFSRFVWRIQRLNYHVRHRMRYVPKIYPGKVILFEAEIQDGPCEPRWGWEPFAAGGLEIITVPGHHGNMMEEDANLTAMAEALQKCLTQAWQNLQVEQVPPAKEFAVE